MMDVALTQHPVGQGAMMSGLLTIAGGRFHWVYDCGSNQTEALNREIAIVAARGDVDCLFLSHLDSDHVNGIDRLLMATPVKEVVLPFLNDLDRLLAAAHDDASGALSGTFLTFLGDIEGWFGARGVERVTFIMPRDDDDGDVGDGEGPELPRFGADGEGSILAKWWSRAEGPRPSIDQSSAGNVGPRLQRLEVMASLHLYAANGMIDWHLLPYAHRPSDAKLSAFRKAMYRKFGPKYPSRLKAMLADAQIREKVRDCYDLIWADHNLVSMALYAGPTDCSSWGGECLHPPGWWRDGSVQAVGWLGTGDMQLNSVRRRTAMIEHYRSVLDQVNVLGLPHHGSHRNFHASLPGVMPKMTQCVAAAGPNGYGHPSAGVREAVQSSGREFLQVSDEGQSVLRWRHRR